MAFFNVREKIVYKPMTEYPGYTGAFRVGYFGHTTGDPSYHKPCDNPRALPDPSYRMFINGLRTDCWYYILIMCNPARHGYGNGYSESVKGVIGASVAHSRFGVVGFLHHELIIKPSQPNITIWSIDNPMTECYYIPDIHPPAAL